MFDEHFLVSSEVYVFLLLIGWKWILRAEMVVEVELQAAESAQEGTRRGVIFLIFFVNLFLSLLVSNGTVETLQLHTQD